MDVHDVLLGGGADNSINKSVCCTAKITFFEVEGEREVYYKQLEIIFSSSPLTVVILIELVLYR